MAYEFLKSGNNCGPAQSQLSYQFVDGWYTSAFRPCLCICSDELEYTIGGCLAYWSIQGWVGGHGINRNGLVIHPVIRQHPGCIEPAGRLSGRGLHGWV